MIPINLYISMLRVSVISISTTAMGRQSQRDRTVGTDPTTLPSAEPDANGMPRFVGHRNHPRIVQGPILALHWGANSDIQNVFISAKNHEAHNIEDYCLSLDMAGLSGLERSSGALGYPDYTCGYCCKGHKASGE